MVKRGRMDLYRFTQAGNEIMGFDLNIGTTRPARSLCNDPQGGWGILEDIFLSFDRYAIAKATVGKILWAPLRTHTSQHR